MDLTTQSATILEILHDAARDRLVIISAGGVDIYRKSDGQRIAWAAIANVTCGCLNNAGIYIGTSDRGMLRLPFDVQDCANGDLLAVFGSGDSVDLGTAIDAVSGYGNALAVVAGATLYYLPNIVTAYSYSAVTPLLCAINASYIVWSDATTVYLAAIPTADWATSDATVSDVANRLQIEAGTDNLQICHTAGLRILDCATPGTSTNFDTDLGTVTNCTGSFRSGNLLAYVTSNGSDGGRFGVLDITDPGIPVSETTVSGDALACWTADDLGAAMYDTTLDIYHLVDKIIPSAAAETVRRDWTIYAEITDALNGIQSGTGSLLVNGQSVSPTITAITGGYAVSYAPGGSSGYAERVTVTLSATDTDGNAVSRTWWFVTTSAPAATVTDVTPPNVVCTRDIGLDESEADEIVGSIPVIWLDDITGPLLVTDAQAVAVGTVAIDGVTYHRHRRSVRVDPTDADGLQTRDLQQGQVVTMTCPAIGMTAQKCEVLACQRNLDDTDEVTFDLQIAYYEEV